MNGISTQIRIKDIVYLESEKRKVKINYYSFVHGNIDRVIRPYDMFLYNNGWGCAAFCELRSDLRHFELKRINKIEILDEKF